MELFLVLVVGVVYAPLLLLLWVARNSNSSSGTMDGPARHAFNGAASSIKVASLNIRYAPGVQNPNAPAAPAQEHPWVLRKEALVDQVLYEMPSILCMQEVLYHQLQDIDKLIGSEYDHVAAGREDGDKQGEAVPIFWNRNYFELLSFEHFWLSDQPHVPDSIGWDAALSRLATLVKLRWRTLGDKDEKSEKKHKEGETFYVLNTHYDHMGIKAREESSKLILYKLRSLMKDHSNGKAPLIIMTGDLNSPPDEEGYQTITGHRYVNVGAKADPRTFYDTRHELLTRGNHTGIPLQRKPYGTNSTFTDFSLYGRKGYNIDFVLVADNGAVKDASGKGSGHWAVTRAGVLPNWVEDGQYRFRLSDHNMVTALLTKAA